MFAFCKWLLFLCMPITLSFFLMFAIVGWLFRRGQWRPAICLCGILTFPLVMSLPWTVTQLGLSLETRYPPQPLSEIPSADAIVLLGGGIGAIEPGVPYPECYPAADRTLMAARLYHAGKAPLIIPTGGGSLLAEKPLLEMMQVPASAILCESEARDTAENASKTFAILRAKKCRRALVVSSSWHLTRAMMLFQAEDITFIPVGCDYEATLTALQAPKAPLWQKLPSVAALAQCSVYLKEWLGIAFYALRAPKAGARPEAPAAEAAEKPGPDTPETRPGSTASQGLVEGQRGPAPQAPRPGAPKTKRKVVQETPLGRIETWE